MGEPTAVEVLDELRWVIDRAEEHLGPDRAGRYLRKHYAWYAERLELDKRVRHELVTAPGHRRGARDPEPDRARGRHRASSLIDPPESGNAVARLPRPPGRRPRIRETRMPRETLLTPQGLEDLKAKIDHLSNDRRREVAERIRDARDFGDIAENSEYDDAKNEQAMLEKQISDLEDKLRNSRVIDESEVTNDAVAVGVTVHVKDQKTDKSTKFKIVGSAEASPAESKLSNESPVGKALMGHKRGEIVSVPVPKGPARKLKITKIDAA